MSTNKKGSKKNGAKNKDQWFDVCELVDIPTQGSRIVKTDAGCIALFRTADNAVYALDDKCPHKQGPLSQGIVHGNSVTCPLHGWVFDLETGQAQGADEGSVKTSPVRIENGSVQIQLT